MPEKPFEVIIIGSGATGGVAALTFAEAGVRVLIVEAGPQLNPEQAIEYLNTNIYELLPSRRLRQKRIDDFFKEYSVLKLVKTMSKQWKNVSWEKAPLSTKKFYESELLRLNCNKAEKVFGRPLAPGRPRIAFWSFKMAEAANLWVASIDY